MGEAVEFASNGGSAGGYLAVPGSGGGPGLIVVQEWWGLNPQIRRTTDRFAEEGFVALAPDLYHGELAGHDEMDKAGQLMAQLPMDRAARDMSGAVDFVAGHSATTGSAIGVVGFCMGGGLALRLGTLRPDKIKAVVSYYGVLGFDDAGAPDWSKLEAAVLGNYGDSDDFFPADKARELEAGLRGLGKTVDFKIYPGRGHAFANEDDVFGTFHTDDERDTWQRTVSFLREHLG